MHRSQNIPNIIAGVGTNRRSFWIKSMYRVSFVQRLIMQTSRPFIERCPLFRG